MNIESVREYCLSLPMAGEDTAFGEEYLLFRVCGKIFACYGFVREDYFVVKCEPDYAVDLRERYADIEPAWHWNKRYWNQLRLNGTLGDVADSGAHTPQLCRGGGETSQAGEGGASGNSGNPVGNRGAGDIFFRKRLFFSKYLLILQALYLQP